MFEILGNGLDAHDDVCAPGLVATARVGADTPCKRFAAFGVQTLAGGAPCCDGAVAYPRHLVGVDGGISVAGRINAAICRRFDQFTASGTCGGGDKALDCERKRKSWRTSWRGRCRCHRRA